MNIKAKDKVILLRDIVRREGPYAKAGETGSVIEVFGNKVGGNEAMRWFAKVKLTGGGIKTFRCTSLKKDRGVYEEYQRNSLFNG
jgi:hypothetical protein